jgi:hypothetical protein
MLDGLDRLYTRSTTSPRPRLPSRSRCRTTRSRVCTTRLFATSRAVDYQPKFNVFVDFAHYEQGRAYDDPTHDELGARMSSTPGITTQDWQLWKSLKKG